MSSRGSRSAAAPRSSVGQSTPRWDAEEFAVCLQGCSSVLWAVAAGILGDRTAAEDVVQEAALIGLEKLDAFQPGTNFTGWMVRIVRNVARNHARRETRRSGPQLDEALHEQDQGRQPVRQDAPGTERSLERAAQDPELLKDAGFLFDGELERALAELSPDARVCLLLKVVLDLEYREIAACLDMKEGTAMSHVHRARARLRALLAGRTAGDILGGLQASPIEEADS